MTYIFKQLINVSRDTECSRNIRNARSGKLDLLCDKPRSREVIHLKQSAFLCRCN